METKFIKPAIDLHKAEFEIAKHNYIRAFKLLIPHVIKFKENYYYLYLLGVACYGKKDYNDAYDYFKTALKITTTPAYEVKLYLALLALTSNNPRKAIEYWLEISDTTKHPHNKYAKYAQKALGIMRDSQNSVKVTQLLIAEPYKRGVLPKIMYPYQKLIFVLKIIGVSLLGASIIAGIIWGFFLIQNYQKRIEHGQERRVVMKDIRDTLQSSAQVINISQYPQYIVLSPNAIKKIIDGLEQKFILYKDNQVQVDINTILYSNALPSDKNKVLLMEDSLRDISFSSDVTWYPYDVVSSEVWKYNNVSVRWRGTLTKIRNASQIKKGQFLVGFYGDSKELKGVVAVEIPNYIEAGNGDELEILAKIKVNHEVLTQNINNPVQSEIEQVRPGFFLEAKEFKFLNLTDN